MENKELRAKTTLQNGKYIIERVIGSGGFGITYLALHNSLGHYFAIKEFFISEYCQRGYIGKTVRLQGIEPAVYDKYLQKFIEEAQILARLDHPNIVKVTDIFQENNTAYMVMPFVDGQTLQQMVDEKGRLNYETAVNYIAQIAEAVDYIHQRDILHRDIKPDNIIITPENKAILIDFGSAREFIQDKTQQHTAIYTQGYAPLEQYASNGRKGSYSDIYSLGAVFYFALTGQKPMDAATRTMETMPEPKTLLPSIPEEANRTIMKAMSLKPENRQQRVKEFMKDLLNLGATYQKDKSKDVTELMEGSQTTVGKKEENAPIKNYVMEEKKTKNKTGQWLIITLLILLIAGGGIFGYVQYDEKQKQIAAENAAYQDAISANTIDAYHDYLLLYPYSKHSDEIRNKKTGKEEEKRRSEQEAQEEKARQDQLAEEIRQQQEREQIIQEQDVGVVINGIRWATRNVDYPGTFAVSPESTGKYYQWNRRTAWDATASGLNTSNPSGTSWIRPNDPCPVGWRLPTQAELQSLINAGGGRTTKNGVSGALFGIAPNQIFLPAAGYIVGVFTDGSLDSFGSSGCYWSSTQDNNYPGNAMNLSFNKEKVGITNYARVNGLCIRCVAE